MKITKRFIVSLIIGLPVAFLWIFTGFSMFIDEGDISYLILGLIIGYIFLSFISCLIFNNNCTKRIIHDVFSWGFVTMPGLITTFDLDGLLWLIAMRILFFLISIALALIAGAVGIVLAFIVSPFVYPFALYRILRKDLLLD